MGVTDKHFSEISALNALVQLLSNYGAGADLSDILANVTSKIDRIKGSADYTRTLTYHGTGTENVITILHEGTTMVGSEILTETITYADPAINGSKVTAITYS